MQRTAVNTHERPSICGAPLQVRARFVERFSMGAPFAGGEVHGPVIKDMSDRVSWVEKFVAVGQSCQQQQQQQEQLDMQSLAPITAQVRAAARPPCLQLFWQLTHLSRTSHRQL